MQAVKNSDKLTLHADQLMISACTLDGVEVGHSADEERQFLILDLAKAGKGIIVAGQYSVACNFTGALSDDNKGFFQTSYYDEIEDRVR